MWNDPYLRHILCKIVFCLIIITIRSNCEDQAQPSVTLPNGNIILGLEQESFFEGRKFFEFRGIPYATASRFKAPVKYDIKWSEPREFIKYGTVCPQDDVMNEPETEGHIEEIVQPIGQEDCLYINVATPAKKAAGPRGHPVAIWIHGGSFQYEYGDAYEPSKFLDYDTILVTFNFRLGALGFLNTGDGLVQGNAGLKDQSLALRWVKENIEAFGGDANAVTVIGVNSGAVSTHLHMISPMSEGLFQKAILQSGSAISPWVLQHNPVKTTANYHSSFNCTLPDTNETLSVFDCLMGADVESLIRKQPRLTEWYIDPLVPMGPSIEVFGDEPKFLSGDPYDILQSGDFWAKDKVTIIAGVNSHEGLLHSWDIAHHKILSNILTMEWQRALPITMTFRDTALNFKNISDSVYQFYFEDKDQLASQADDTNSEQLSAEQETETLRPTKGKNVKDLKNTKMIGKNFYLFQELTQMYSDRYFFIPLHKTGQLLAQGKAPVYLYWFDYQGSQSSTQFSGYNDTVVGAAHFDQIQYMFSSPYFKDPTDEGDISFGKKFMSGINHFIATGEPPSQEWIPISRPMLEGSVPFIYNRIGEGKKFFQLIEPFTESLQFWEGLPLIEYGKERSSFPEFYVKDYAEKEGGDEVIPGVTKDDVEKLKAKLEL